MDTNIIINFSIKDKPSEKIVEKYRNKEKMGGSFITHKVRDQSIDFAAKFTYYTFLVEKRMEQKNLSFQEAHKDIIEDFQGSIREPLKGLFGNIIDYLKNTIKTKKDLHLLKKEIVSKIRFFHSLNRNIQPPLNSIDKEENRWIDTERFIKEKKLVASEDVEIIMQIWWFYKLERSDIDLVTYNISDFHSDKKAWKKKLSFLTLFKPEDWLSTRNF